MNQYESQFHVGPYPDYGVGSVRIPGRLEECSVTV